MCMSQSLPTLFRNATGYRRQLTFAHWRNRRGDRRRPPEPSSKPSARTPRRSADLCVTECRR